tara:strand:- start:1873 stop:2241 length:369 start_codon:yes stop_codon:yes gene_type:complete
MKIHERYLWIGALIVSAFMVQGKIDQLDRLDSLLETYKLESQIQNAQISDFHQELQLSKGVEYTKGFEDGRSQAGIAFTQGRPMLDYADGYHAALSQFVTKELSEEDQLLKDLEEDIANSNE